MLDRYGWQLGIGDPVTVHAPCGNPRCVHGAHGTVVDFGSEHLIVRLATAPLGHADETTVSIRPQHVEYGYAGLGPDPGPPAREGVSVTMPGLADACVQEAVAAGIADSVITAEQGAKLVAAWRNRAADESRP
ncbi:hypothetical protein [Nocardia mexicana]|uniref:Uncharacterized protein n=1 Tax=Nocardia mexicana TaxID=279262 RepID=A0A370HCH1_9NOCA|nr:hypothetical protein [Nocardia mexicana]RDI54075.1 hypothetical protein DFR68_102198 [Nocardia mexicana]